MDTLIAAVGTCVLALGASLNACGGVILDGVEPVPGSSGPGWTFDNGELRLRGASGTVLSGVETGGLFRVSVESDSSLCVSNLVLDTPKDGFCAIKIAPGAALDLRIAGSNSISSGPSRAGIEVPPGATLAISEALQDGGQASLEVRGGASAAGIGGTGGFGDGGACGIVSIAGRVSVASTGGSNAAGIGGGWGGAGGEVLVGRGARVRATGGWNAPGVGGGRDGAGGFLRIDGGVIEAAGGASAPGIVSSVRLDGGFVSAAAGPGASGTPDVLMPSGTELPLVIGGGTLVAAGGKVSGDAFSPDGVPLFPVSVPLGTNTASSVEVPGGIDLSLAEPDTYGNLVLWLPLSVTEVSVAGERVTVRETPPPTGITVNGVDVSSVAGSGWLWTEPVLRLRAAGPFVLSGSDASGRVAVRAEAPECGILLDGLSLDASRAGLAAFHVVSGCVARVSLAGTNVLVSGTNHAGLQADDGAEVRFETSDGQSVGANPAVLEAVGGVSGAGIGGGEYGSGGSLVFAASNAVIRARGGRRGAGVGAGARGTADAISILGGEIFATGGDEASGLGGGAWGGGAALEVSGGLLRAVGGTDGSGVGGGKFGRGGSLKMTGGTVIPTAQPDVWAVGGGAGDTAPPRGPVEVEGGSLTTGNVRISPAPTRKGAGRTTRRGIVREVLPLRRVPASLDATNSLVEISGLSGYGVSDIWGDASGSIVLWLPWGNAYFSLPDGRAFAASMSPDILQQPFRPATGVSVGGIDAAAGDGPGWHWDGGEVSFNGPGPFILSGTCVDGRVSFAVPTGNSVELVLSNLVVSAKDGLPALRVERKARVAASLSGVNSLTGGTEAAAAEIGEGAKLRILRRKGGGSLEMTAGPGAASALAPHDGAFGTVSAGSRVESSVPPLPESGTKVSFSASP